MEDQLAQTTQTLDEENQALDLLDTTGDASPKQETKEDVQPTDEKDTQKTASQTEETQPQKQAETEPEKEDNPEEEAKLKEAEATKKAKKLADKRQAELNELRTKDTSSLDSQIKSQFQSKIMSVSEIAEKEDIEYPEAERVHARLQQESEAQFETIRNTRKMLGEDSLRVMQKYPELDRESADYDSELWRDFNDFYINHYQQAERDPVTNEISKANSPLVVADTLMSVARRVSESALERGKELGRQEVRDELKTQSDSISGQTRASEKKTPIKDAIKTKDDGVSEFKDELAELYI